MPKEMNVEAVSLKYSDTGSKDAKALLLLHGLGSSHKDWKFQIPEFSKNYRVIAPDLRGHGESFQKGLDYGVEYMVSDIVALIEKLNIKSVTPIGFSMGGAVAFQLAASYPHLIDKMVIVNSGPDFNDMGQLGEDLLQGRTTFLKTKGLDALAKEIAYNMFPDKGQEDLREEFEERCRANDYDAYYNAFTTLMDWGLGNQLKTLDVETLVVASDMDYSPVSFKESYVKRMNNATLKVVNNSRHGVVLDQPEAFNKLVLDFLKNE